MMQWDYVSKIKEQEAIDDYNKTVFSGHNGIVAHMNSRCRDDVHNTLQIEQTKSQSGGGEVTMSSPQLRSYW